MCKFPNGLIISPLHPIYMIDFGWTFPKDHIEPTPYNGEYIYNIILDTGHIVSISNIQCITLAHNYNNNEIIRHDYLGTDKVLEDIRVINTNNILNDIFLNGLVDINGVGRGDNGYIKSFY